MSDLVTCKWCGYGWEPRVDNPKACPECKRRHPTVRKTSERGVAASIPVSKTGDTGSSPVAHAKDPSAVGTKLSDIFPNGITVDGAGNVIDDHSDREIVPVDET